MKETKHTGGLMEFRYDKDYKPKWNEGDNMRKKSIKQYYEKEDLIRTNKEKNKKIIMIIISLLIILLFVLKILKIV